MGRDEARAAIAALRAAPVAELPSDVLLDEVRELFRLRDELEGAITRALRVAHERGAPAEVAGHTTKTWLVHACRLSPGEAARRVFVLRALPLAPVTAAALEDGRISTDSARAIVSLLPTLASEDREPAERILVDLAERTDPAQVARAAYGIAERTMSLEGREAAAEARRASRYLSLAPTIGGMVSVNGMLEPEAGEALVTAITALSEPTVGDGRTSTQRRADAAGELARHYLACGELPDNGGERPQVVVTIPWTLLEDAVGVAYLPASGAPISPAAARRLACDAGVLPAVLGSDGAVLDVGRSTRLWPTAIRRAARLRDGGCSFPGCTVPLDRCELHHIEWWSRGGVTSLANSAHLCPFHHHLVHEDGWSMYRASPTEVVFVDHHGREYRAPPRMDAA